MTTAPTAILRMDMPELVPLIGTSLRAAERELEDAAGRSPLLDATYADTHRFPPPAWAADTFAAAAGGLGMTYTPYRGDNAVREQVSANIESVLGIPATGASQVILTPGTQGALFIALAAILEPGDVVLLPDPDYLSTERMLRYFGAEVIRIPMLYEHEGRPVLDAEILTAAAARRPKLMVFSHPNNPTGMIYDDTTLALIAELAEVNNFHVLADQLYCRLVYDGEKYTSLAALPGMAERTITLLGPSKTESLSGYRLGVAVAPRAILDRMEDVQSCTALRAPAYAQHLLSRWLVDDQDYLATRIAEYEVMRDLTVAAINTSTVLQVRPSFGSAYVFPKVLIDASDQEIALALKKSAGVVVNPGYQFGPRGIGHMRLCFAQEQQVWEEALQRIIDVLEALGRG